MPYLKYILVLLLSITTYSCCATQAVVKEEKIIAETDTNTKSEVVITEVEAINKANIPNEDLNTETDSLVSTATGRFIISHDTWNTLLQKNVSDQGNVNYKGFKTDISAFNSYLTLLSENPPETSWTKDETLAYWINVYNAFTVKLILDNYPVKSIKDINGPWNHRFINIGEKWFTLNDVEHRIIRKMDEPRIHFTLVCAAVSCPKLYNKAFTAKTLEADLDKLTRAFLSDPSKNELSENSIKLSRIFKWYGGDFKTNGNSLIDFLNQYSEVTISSRAKKSYKDYNWDLNE
ncbi:DUF547 domain-containing protein [uncultured Psychroserpens sp.]|uniref:DUF547 domain-containing protein n=1 Tax=uncultured Psychroserpens sp. TaxID=255436 RepID=UPI00261A5E09|nr:DUF547 domain-containing protein [uncultured Psychroserpens sp.]